MLGTEFKLGGFPLAALLSVTWVYTLALSLRYCQDAIAVDRQYPYVHKLEQKMSSKLGAGRVYRREGNQYLHDYPLMLNVAWYAYVVLFPIVVIFAISWMLVVECSLLESPVIHKIFDTVLGISTASVFYLYRIDPYVKKKIRDWKSKMERKTGVA